MPTTLSPRAVGRLMRDLREVQMNPLPTVAALPLPHDLSVWHVNLRTDEGPFKGSVFHFRLQFPFDYPNNPPAVEMLSTGMPAHPNVFGSAGNVYICLSMLKPHLNGVKYDGWTSAYSCTSLLLQLQSFLFESGSIEQDYGETDWHSARAYDRAEWNSKTIADVRRNNERFFIWIDEELRHTHEAPWPPFVAVSTTPVSEAVRAACAVEVLERELVEMHCRRRDALQRIAAIDEMSACARARAQSGAKLSYRDVSMLQPARHALPASCAALERKLAAARSVAAAAAAAEACEAAKTHQQGHQLSVNLADFPADVLVMVADRLRAEDLPSFGRVCTAWRDVAVRHQLFARRQLCCFHSKERYGDVSGTLLGVGLSLELHSGGSLKEVSTPFDLLSEAAFSQDRKRLSVWKLPFTHFLPLAIEAPHFRRTLPHLQAITKQVFGPSAKTTHLLDLLAAAMNSMVVDLFNTKATADGVPPLHASEVALNGYCAFHHLLLSSAHQWPDIRAEAERRVRAFLTRDKCREKRETPDLGRLLVCLTLSSAGWPALRYPFLREMLSRNVLWVLRAKPRLRAISPSPPVSSTERARETFEASSTSLRLVAFQVSFLQLVGRPDGTTGPHDVLAAYERRLGQPTAAQRTTLQDTAKRTLALSSWREFFALVGAAMPDAPKLHELLVEAVTSSAAKGYHGGGNQGGKGGKRTSANASRMRS